ncbi:MAG: nucleotidyltransferase domain-containing protein [Patescibacteria group bacterium]
MVISTTGLVLLTLAYTDQFSFPLRTSEIYQRLVARSCSQKKIFQILKKLADKDLVFQQDGYWQLKSERADFQLRLAREKLAQARWAEVDELLKVVGWIPWIKGVVVTGSFAVKNAQPKSDIDFMIVTVPHRLWMSRLVVALIVFVVGKRRTWHGDEDNSWCFNLWLDLKNLSLLANKQTIYSAYEVCQAKWVLDKDNLQYKFYQVNSWVEGFLPNYYHQKNLAKNLAKNNVKQYKPAFKWYPILCWLWSGLLALIDLLAYSLQLVYMYPHMTREKVSLGTAYFHPRNTRSMIYRRWYNSLLSLLSL